MLCRVRIIYREKQVVVDDKTDIDFHFLKQSFGFDLAKERSRNPVVLSIQIIDHKEIWVSKNSFTTSVFVKFNEYEPWKSLLVSDGFELEDKAYLKIENNEMRLEKILERGLNSSIDEHKSHHSSQNQNQNPINSTSNIQIPSCTSASNNMLSIESDNNSQHNNQGFVFVDEESEEFGDLIDDLLSGIQPSQSCNLQLNKSQMQEDIEEDQEEETGRRLKVTLNYTKKPKDSFKKADTLKRQKDDVETDLNEEDLEPLLLKKKVKNIQNPEDLDHMNSIKTWSPLSNEIHSSKTSEKKFVSGDNNMRDMMQEEIKENNITTKYSINFNGNVANDNSHLLGRTVSNGLNIRLQHIEHKYNFKGYEENKNKNLLDVNPQALQERLKEIDEDPEALKLQKLRQIVEEKRSETAKSSVRKIQLSQEPKENKETCSICLNDSIEEVGKINSCPHVFCFGCIQDWSKITNECPLCKLRFNEIIKSSPNGLTIETVKVKFKKQVYEEEYVDEEEEETDENCYECGNNDDTYLLLICDACGFYCCHTYCCTPALDHIPDGDWHCKHCEQRSRRGQRRRNNRDITLNRGNTLPEYSERSRRSTRNTRRGNQQSLEDFFGGNIMEMRGFARLEAEEGGSRNSGNSRASTNRRNNNSNRSAENSNQLRRSSRLPVRNQGRVNV